MVNIIHLNALLYNDNDVITPLHLFISQTTGYINKFKKNKITMALMVEDK